MKFLYNNISLKEKDIQDYIESIKILSQKMEKGIVSESYIDPNGFLHLPEDKDALKEIKELKERLVSSNLKYVLVVGIGGSSMGAMGIYEALFGYGDIYELNRFPKIIFVETCDSEIFSKLETLIASISHPSEILVSIVTKSGKTTETIINTNLIIGLLKRFKDFSDRIVCITNRNSEVWNIAKKNKFSLLEIPEMVGGRYSIFSPAGLFPLACIGVDISALCEGAISIHKMISSDTILENYPAISAIALYLSMKGDKKIHNTFIFHPEFENIGKWYKQLMAESTGKNENIGMVPTVSIGSQDLHSIAQLYLGGPDDIVTTFIYTEKRNILHKISPDDFSKIIGDFESKSLVDVMSAIYEGTKNGYKKANRQFMEIILPDISEHSLGAFLEFKMIEIVYLAGLMKVDAFNQPDVEKYKEEVRKIMNY